MASSMIHICVANEVNKIIKKDRKSILIGSIAPDISKLLNQDKVKSHFLDNSDTDVPNIQRFLSKYKSYLDDDFVLGYYIHLYTDYLWFKYFLPRFANGGYIFNLNGNIQKVSKKELIDYLYNDYTNLNIKLIDEYNLSLDLFYEEVPEFNNIISEIPMNNLSVIIDKAGIIIENTKVHKPYMFDMKEVKNFIGDSVKRILDNLIDINVIENI